MQGVWKQEISILLLSFLCACLYAMKVDFSRLRQIRKPFILDKRGDSCSMNPCPEDKPFLCRSPEKTCISLGNVCDQISQCPDGFDESPRMCNARNRPSVDELEDFVYRNEGWMIPKLFNGAPAELIAQSLAVSSNIQELGLMIGLDPESEQNLREAFEGVEMGDERPLTKLGMPDSEWYDVQYNLNRILEGGFQY